jgi:hypothetical protein
LLREAKKIRDKRSDECGDFRRAKNLCRHQRKSEKGDERVSARTREWKKGLTRPEFGRMVSGSYRGNAPDIIKSPQLR